MLEQFLHWNSLTMVIYYLCMNIQNFPENFFKLFLNLDMPLCSSCHGLLSDERDYEIILGNRAQFVPLLACHNAVLLPPHVRMIKHTTMFLLC